MTPRLTISTLLLAASVALPHAAGAQSSPAPAPPPVAPSALPVASTAPSPAPGLPSSPETSASAAASGDDPFIWLEDVSGKRSMDWVKAENAKTLGVLEQDPHYAGLYADALSLAQAKDRIASPQMLHGRIFNFWQDADHVRGIWRETTAADYATVSPHWNTVLDLDALSRAEKANWVWEGADCREPAENTCILRLSDGGEDAVTLREYDISARRFVFSGYTFSRGKQDQAWGLDGSLLLARAWSPGQLTSSGYPYVVKRVRRGQSPAQAIEVFRGKASDVGASPYTLQDGAGNAVELIRRDVTFFESEQYVLGPHGAQRLALPLQSSVDGLVAGRLIVKLNEDWKSGAASFGKGSVVSLALAALKADPGHLHPTLVVAPGARDSIESETPTKSALIVASLHDVRGRAAVYTPSGAGWSHKALAFPDNSTIAVVTTSSRSDDAYLSVTNFLVPSTLWNANVATGSIAVTKRTPERFDASKDTVEQFEAISKDGTRVPYFVVHPTGMKLDGTNPTVIDAYGGFLVSSTPSYSATVGKLWLERGGVYVVANIRGGGEFGPAWHDAGLKTHRQRIYDDFYAVAQDVIAKKITSTQKLGIMGGSNGGLLMGVEMTQHPEEYKAIDIEVPLLDMLRFEQIAAGASWVGEYGSVKVPAERAFLAKISPYNQLKPGVTYPEAFIWTTTKDDRVGPQHARKFAAKLASFGDPYLYYEVIEGGHGAGANLKERAHTSALEWTYFSQKLGS